MSSLYLIAWLAFSVDKSTSPYHSETHEPRVQVARSVREACSILRAHKDQFPVPYEAYAVPIGYFEVKIELKEVIVECQP